MKIQISAWCNTNSGSVAPSPHQFPDQQSKMLKKLVEAGELMAAACPLTVALLRPTVLDGVGMLAPIARCGDTDPSSPCLVREPSPRHHHGERIWPQFVTRLG